ncbi:MAG: serine/threonine-protein kinase [Gemmatimonadaceae bacterium]
MTCATEVPAGGRFCLHCGSAVTDPGAMTLMLDEHEHGLLLRIVRRQLAREYDVERELGRGGMAVVYKAVDIELGRLVALKVLPPEIAHSHSVAERFKREAKLAASLDHPNIIPIYRVGQAGGVLYIAMKFIEGRPLDAMIESQGALPLSVVLTVARSAARALAVAHERGIVHRDIKSANILIDEDGRVLVSDFGIARAVEDPSMTAPGTVVGTPYFMSPEQCGARQIGPQSDQYSLGVVTFHMLTGIVPFYAETLPGIMHHHFYTPVPDLHASRPDLPAPLIAVVNRILAKKPEQRYATSRAMLEAIEEIPFSEFDRREGEQLLRALARGTAIPDVKSTALPPLASPVRLTPPSVPVQARARSGRPGLIAAAAACVAAVPILVIGAHWTGSDPSIEPRVAEAALIAPAVTVGMPAAGGTSEHASLPERVRANTQAADTNARRSAPHPAATIVLEQIRDEDALPPPPSPPAEQRSHSTESPGLVRIRAYPASAEILLDGRRLGTGVVIDSIVTAGPRRLSIRAAGFVDFDTTVTVVSGETLQLSGIELSPVATSP